MSIEVNRQIMIRYFEEVWNRGRLDVLDRIIAPDYRNHSPGFPNPPPGPTGIKPIVEHMRAGISDLHYQILDLIVTEDKPAAYVRMTGTHTGELFGVPPTRRKIDTLQMQVEWFRDGRICQHWRITDDLTVMKQLGQL